MIDKYFDQLDETTDKYLLGLAKTVSPTNDKLFSELSELIGSLDKTSDGYIKSTVSNLKKLSAFNKIFKSSTSIYSTGVKTYLNAFAANQKTMSGYFTALDVGFTDKTIYDLVRQESADRALASLLESGIDTAFKEPIRKLLGELVVNGSSRTEAISALKNWIYGQGDRVAPLEKYVNQVAEDTISQFNGSYIATVSDDLGLEHFYYRGTKITDSREFCIHLAGKYATYDRLEELVNTKSSGNGWAGMIPGTNMGNFMTNRGGYRCRHYLLPVSKTVYDANKSKQL